MPRRAVVTTLLVAVVVTGTVIATRSDPPTAPRATEERSAEPAGTGPGVGPEPSSGGAPPPGPSQELSFEVVALDQVQLRQVARIPHGRGVILDGGLLAIAYSDCGPESTRISALQLESQRLVVIVEHRTAGASGVPDCAGSERTVGIRTAGSQSLASDLPVLVQERTT